MTTSLQAAILHSGDRRLDVLGVGTALVDHLSFASLELVAALGLSAGTMTLIQDELAARARAELGQGTIVSGGTVANTVVGVASLGGRSAFVGAVAPDAFGMRYGGDLAESGVEPLLSVIDPGPTDAATGACYVMITPDEERTMATHLGVSGQLRAEDISEAHVASARICYFDGYLFDFPDASRVVERLVEYAKRHGTALALGLADPFVVERHYGTIFALLPELDLLFSNQDEIRALTGESSVEGAVRAAQQGELVVAVTRSADGATIASRDELVSVPAISVPRVVDVTGAGDLFAAGMLHGVISGLTLGECATRGAICAAEIISHVGARPLVSLATLATVSSTK